jgi:hypothetical protein
MSDSTNNLKKWSKSRVSGNQNFVRNPSQKELAKKAKYPPGTDLRSQVPGYPAGTPAGKAQSQTIQNQTKARFAAYKKHGTAANYYKSEKKREQGKGPR